MMGSKERHFASFIHVSLEELVPHDRFYRHLERSLDVSFVHQFVLETYARGGGASIEPNEADEQAMQWGRRMLISTAFKNVAHVHNQLYSLLAKGRSRDLLNISSSSFQEQSISC